MSNADAAPAQAETPPSDPKGPPSDTQTIQQRAVRGAAYTVGAHVASQGLRLVSNLILTRLLFPEAFGLMALVNSFMTALQMFSDLGIRVSIISDKDGEAPRFLNTAFTLGVMRGFVLWMVCCAMSWPMALFYEQPALLSLIPVVGLQALILSFGSTKATALHRNLHLGRLTALDLMTQVISLVTMITWARFHPSVWALVAGSLASATIRVILTHTVLPGMSNRFVWDPEAARKLMRVGRWIVLATILTWVADKSDRMILGATMADFSKLGVYHIAAFMAQAVAEGLSAIANRVLFPLYARLSELEDGAALRARIARVRTLLLLLAIPPLAILVALAPQVLQVMYDSRYATPDGIWMLQVLAAGSIATCVALTSSPVLLARGDSFRHMAVLGWRTVTLIIGLLIGSRWGVRGQIVAIALNPLLGYPALAVATRAHGVWMPRVDVVALSGAASLVLLFTAARRAFLGDW